MPWSNKIDGQKVQSLHRTLGGLETIYHLTSQSFKHVGQEQWLLRTSCKVEFGLTTPEFIFALRYAWQQLVRDHPSLAVIVKGGQASFDLERSDHVQETFFVHHDDDYGGNSENVVAQYQLRDLPALLYLVRSQEVMLLSSHWRIDATGCCILLDRLFSLVSRVVSQQHHAEHAEKVSWPVPPRLSPSLEDAANSPLKPDEVVLRMADVVTRKFREAAAKTLGLIYKGDAATAPAQTACTNIELTKSSTEALLSKCKAARPGISVSAAVFTALGFAMFDQQHNADQNEYTSIMAVNMRPHLPEPYNSADYACAAYVTSITPTIRRQDGFRKNAESLTQEFKTWHTKEYDAALREIYARASNALMIRRPELPPGTLPPPPPNGITLSSLGIIDNIIQSDHRNDVTAPLRVTDFRFQANIFTRQMLMYLWTFRGRLHLSLNYNMAYYEAESLQRLLAKVVDVLRDELDIDLLMDS